MLCIYLTGAFIVNTLIIRINFIAIYDRATNAIDEYAGLVLGDLIMGNIRGAA